jgi:hypothetical protein
MGIPLAKLVILGGIFYNIGQDEHITLSHNLLSVEYGTSTDARRIRS